MKKTQTYTLPPVLASGATVRKTFELDTKYTHIMGIRLMSDAPQASKFRGQVERITVGNTEVIRETEASTLHGTLVDSFYREIGEVPFTNSDGKLEIEYRDQPSPNVPFPTGGYTPRLTVLFFKA